MKTVSWGDLPDVDLHVDACYQGGRKGNAGDDPLVRLVGVSNQGGFRYLGSKEQPRLIVLTSSMADPDWPDHLDVESGVFTYFGDNKRPGRELHDTPRVGNSLLRDLFARAHGGPGHRAAAAPVLVFSRAAPYRDVVFRGLAVPGAVGLSQVEDLVAVWKTRDGQRFQNYRAQFTILDEPVISRAWLGAIQQGATRDTDAPKAWIDWREGRTVRPLKAARSIRIRAKDEQVPASGWQAVLLDRVRKRYGDNPFLFEKCAARIVQLHLGQVAEIDLTRPFRDGGRDAVGSYRVGTGDASILVEFAMEAKCYGASNSVGVKEMSRLISRLRHRQFGVLVTTSYVHQQAYSEVVDDGHPVVIIAGADVASILVRHGINDVLALDAWLDSI